MTALLLLLRSTIQIDLSGFLFLIELFRERAEDIFLDPATRSLGRDLQRQGQTRVAGSLALFGDAQHEDKMRVVT
jgi:hypothetical protein